MLKLFTAPATCALAVHIALEEAGVPYEVQWVDLARQAQREPAFLAVNPKGRVPALATPEGVLTETPALLEFVARSAPAAGLLPDSAFDLARLQSFNTFLCATVHVAHAHGRRATRWVDASEQGAIDAMKRGVPVSMAAAFELVEDQLQSGPWVMGDRYTIADPYLFTMAGWLEGDGVDPARFPRVKAHGERVAARPAVARVLAQRPA